jgi:hypothetical protein
MGSRSKQKVVRSENKPSANSNEAEKIQVQPGNIPLLTIQLLNSINRNLGVLITYLKNRDIENGRLKRPNY